VLPITGELAKLLAPALAALLKRGSGGGQPASKRRVARTTAKSSPQRELEDYAQSSRERGELRRAVMAVYFHGLDAGKPIHEAITDARAEAVRHFGRTYSERTMCRWRDRIMAAGGFAHCPALAFIDGKSVTRRRKHK